MVSLKRCAVLVTCAALTAGSLWAQPSSTGVIESAVKAQVAKRHAKGQLEVGVNAEKIEGDWAACHFFVSGKGIEGGGIMVLHRSATGWRVVREMAGRGGPVEPRQWTLDVKAEPLHGCRGENLPADVVALFGYGPVPKSAVAALKTQARRLHPGPGRYNIATHGPKLFARTTWSAKNRAVVWEWIEGAWSPVFQEDNSDFQRQFSTHGFSEWMTFRLTGEAAASGQL